MRLGPRLRFPSPGERFAPILPASSSQSSQVRYQELVGEESIPGDQIRSQLFSPPCQNQGDRDREESRRGQGWKYRGRKVWLPIGQPKESFHAQVLQLTSRWSAPGRREGALVVLLGQERRWQLWYQDRHYKRFLWLWQWLELPDWAILLGMLLREKEVRGQVHNCRWHVWCSQV